MPEADSTFLWLAAEHEPNHDEKSEILLAKISLGAQGGFVKLAAQRRRITL